MPFGWPGNTSRRGAWSSSTRAATTLRPFSETDLRTTRQFPDDRVTFMTAPVQPTPHQGLPAIPAAPDGTYTIVHLCAEYSPFARTGGLAEAVMGLANYQVKA